MMSIFIVFKKGERGQGEGFSDYLNIDIEIYIEIFNKKKIDSKKN